MREKFARFMMGRYGQDELNQCALHNRFGSFGHIDSGTQVCSDTQQCSLDNCHSIVVICYYRMFSRDIARRSAENQKFLNFRYSLAVKKQRKAEMAAQSKDFKFFKCPKCGVYNRIPKGKGKIEITCPKCGEKFIRKS